MNTRKSITILGLCLLLATTAVGCTKDVIAVPGDGVSIGVPAPVETGSVDMEYPALDGVEEMIVLPDGEQNPVDENLETAPLEDFEFQLMQVVENLDFEGMTALMNETFGFGLWRSEGVFVDSPEAIEQLQLNYLLDENVISYPDEPDLTSILPDGDILKVWNLETNPVSAIFSSGWGTNGTGEAFLIITQQPDGSFLWSGMIYAPGGFITTMTP